MSGEFTITQANGLLKTVYGKQLIQVLPEAALLQKKYPLAADVAIVGDHYEVPVAVRMPQGHSFNGTSGGVVALNGPLAGKTQAAQVFPYEYVLREQVSYGLLDRAKNGGQAAFMSAMTLEGKMMALSARNILEIQALHGQQGIMTVGAPVAGQVITVDAATLTPGILAILEGANIDVYQSNLSTLRQGGLSVTAVDVDAGTITVTGTVTGITTTDVIFFTGANSAGTFNEQLGLGAQLSAVSGTQFNINKATYSAFRASVLASVGEFTPSALVNAAVKSMNRGFSEGELTAIMPPKAWGVIDSALATNETFPNGYTASRKTGSDDIEVRANGIRIVCMAHPFQKQGQVYIVPSEYVKRVGAVDLTFAKAGSEEEFLRDVPGFNAMERQARANWQLFLERPAYSSILTGITYSS
jgi:hypothetical protein